MLGELGAEHPRSRLLTRRVGAAVDHGVVRAAATRVVGEAGLFDPPRPSLVHMDPGSDHWFVEGDEVVGLIDLESAEAADPVFDLAWWDHWRGWG